MKVKHAFLWMILVLGASSVANANCLFIFQLVNGKKYPQEMAREFVVEQVRPLLSDKQGMSHEINLYRKCNEKLEKIVLDLRSDDYQITRIDGHEVPPEAYFYNEENLRISSGLMSEMFDFALDFENFSSGFARYLCITSASFSISE